MGRSAGAFDDGSGRAQPVTAIARANAAAAAAVGSARRIDRTIARVLILFAGDDPARTRRLHLPRGLAPEAIVPKRTRALVIDRRAAERLR